ncbi:MAG: galactokinase [Spirochaetales bacterium]|nr:galactokinase [Spirochaetales bacterium]
MNKTADPDHLFSAPCFTGLYQNNNPAAQKARYTDLHCKFIALWENRSYTAFSAPGRVEIGGNHTDHNNGRVIAAAINRDAVCFAAKTDDNRVTLYDLKYDEHIEVDLSGLECRAAETHSCHALIRGIAAGLRERGYNTGGFCGCLHSEVLAGSGLSSSAALEILLVRIFSYFYNNNAVSALESALIGQFAENSYFGKPCGLMDQMASAFGGLVSIDFRDRHNPLVTGLGDPFTSAGYCLAVVNSGGDHRELTGHYSMIPAEMKQAAGCFGRQNCRELSMEDLYTGTAKIRQQAGDRALLRAFHFINENNRVEAQLKALQSGKTEDFLKLVAQSGNSSWKYLQNISVPENPRQQDLAVALAWADHFCSKYGGACRVHGGGFAGTILIFCRDKDRNTLNEFMTGLFGPGSLMFLSVRESGPCIVEQIST